MDARFLVTMAMACRDCCVGCIGRVVQIALSPVMQVRSSSYYFMASFNYKRKWIATLSKQCDLNRTRINRL